jgi:hypothetical protein
VELEGPDVFDGCAVERLLDKVAEASGVKGVGIDGSRCQVADLHVLGEPPSHLAGPFFVGRHDVCVSLPVVKTNARAEPRGSAIKPTHPIKVTVSKSASLLIVLIGNWQSFW